MSREIKFRGQDFETGKWMYGSYNGVNAGAADVFIIYDKNHSVAYNKLRAEQRQRNQGEN